MSDLLWLIGSGQMAQDYARVLVALDQPFEVIGRGVQSAKSFENATGKAVKTGGLKEALINAGAPKAAIVAVGVEQLASVASELIKAGTKGILVEKPGALTLDEISDLDNLASEAGAQVLIAYNRRFYQSVQVARKLIAEDGGVLSMHFEFTEWSHTIAPLVKGSGVKEHWLLGNSSHVIDLAFHLGGRPVDWSCWHRGSLDWHSASARFCGAGMTEREIMFSYLADWEAPGRWGVELMTKNRRLILRPMEQLQITKIGSVNIEPIESENDLDTRYKPGLFKQTQAFLANEDALFCTLREQVKNIEIFSKMAGYL